MATNFYFQNFTNFGEQRLIQDLITESIKIYGQDMYYVPRTLDSFDPLYTEDDTSIYKKAIMVEMYIKNVDGFQGDGDFLSNFGVEIRDRVTFTVSRTVFSEEVESQLGINRPREGDLIFFPLNNKLFKIMFVEHEEIFYQLGALQTYDLVCELYEFSGERFNTGNAAIDDLDNTYQFNTNTGVVGTPVINDSDFFQQQANTFIDFTELNPFSEGGKV